MLGGRRRGRRRRSGRDWRRILLVTAAVGLVLYGGAWDDVGTNAFDTARAERGGGVDVATDKQGVQGLDKASAVRINATDPLVNVTNQFGREVEVTVSLRSNSTDLGDLVVGGVNEGDVATFTLADGATRQVELSVPDNSSLVGETVYYDVNSSATGLTGNTRARNATVESS